MTRRHKQKNPAEPTQATLEKVRRWAQSFAEPNDLEVHEVCFGPTDFGLTLSVSIKPSGGDGRAISSTDCEVVSRPLSKELDDLTDDFPENYILEVTSVGIDEEEA